MVVGATVAVQSYNIATYFAFNIKEIFAIVLLCILVNGMLLHLVIAIQYKRCYYVLGYLAQSLMLGTFLMYNLIKIRSRGNELHLTTLC